MKTVLPLTTSPQRFSPMAILGSPGWLGVALLVTALLRTNRSKFLGNDVIGKEGSFK
jgi:hypothetical protein